MSATFKNDLQNRIKNFSDSKLLDAVQKLGEYNKEAQEYIQQEFQKRGLELPPLPQLTELEEAEALLREEPIPEVFSNATRREIEFFPSIDSIPYEEKNGEKIFFQSGVISSKTFGGKAMNWKNMHYGIIGGIILGLLILGVSFIIPYPIYESDYFGILLGVLGAIILLGFILVSVSMLVSTHQFIIKQNENEQIVVSIEEPKTIGLIYPFSYQYYNEFFTYQGNKRVYLVFEKEEHSFALGYSLNAFQNFPLGCQSSIFMKKDMTIYYLQGRKGNRSGRLRKILETIKRG